MAEVMKRRSLSIKVLLSVLFLGALFWSNWAILCVGFAWIMKPPVDSELSYLPPPLSPLREAKCRAIDKGKIVESVIDDYVETAKLLSESDPNGKQSLRYTSPRDFMEENPDCCELLDRIPGDYSIKTQRLGAPHSDPPRLFAVRVSYKVWAPDDTTSVRTKVRLVDCFGRIGKGPSFDLRRGMQ